MDDIDRKIKEVFRRFWKIILFVLIVLGGVAAAIALRGESGQGAKDTAQAKYSAAMTQFANQECPENRYACNVDVKGETESFKEIFCQIKRISRLECQAEAMQEFRRQNPHPNWPE